MRDPLWRGIARHGAGWRASVSQGRDRQLVQKHFDKATDPRVMQAWRKDTKATLHVTRKQRATMGSFEHDARRYLKAVTALTTFKERQRDIELWVAVFGRTQRSDISPADIRAQRDQWLTEPRSETDARPLAPGTVNKRLRALSNLFSVLDGPRADNPARSVPEAREPAPEARAIPYPTIAAILAAMPDQGRADRGKKRAELSRSKTRLQCLAYCQLTPGQLAQLTPADLDLEHGRLRLPPRQKGRGAKAIWTPLTPMAVEAFKIFHQSNCYGKFSQSSLRKSFKSAAQRVAPELVGVRVYDLRHSVASALALLSKDERAVQAMMQHGNSRTTQRYTVSSVSDRLRSAVDLFTEFLKQRD